MRNIYGVEPGEAFWAASDVGWVLGHSYIVYGPLGKGFAILMETLNGVFCPSPLAPFPRWGEGDRSLSRFSVGKHHCHYILQCSVSAQSAN
jgi:hypothetical protein